MSTTDTKQVFTTGEAAELCNVSQQTIIRCFDQGRLDGFRVPGSRFRRIPRESLLKFMQDNDIPTAALQAECCNVLVIGDDPTLIEPLRSAINDRKVSIHPACTAWDAGSVFAHCAPELVLQFTELPGLSFDATESLIESSNNPGCMLIRCTTESVWWADALERIRSIVGSDGVERAGGTDHTTSQPTIS
jgi:excisionase family DNA binding protein